MKKYKDFWIGNYKQVRVQTKKISRDVRESLIDFRCELDVFIFHWDNAHDDFSRHLTIEYRIQWIPGWKFDDERFRILTEYAYSEAYYNNELKILCRRLNKLQKRLGRIGRRFMKRAHLKRSSNSA
jgi:hypothetical protein